MSQDPIMMVFNEAKLFDERVERLHAGWVSDTVSEAYEHMEEVPMSIHFNPIERVRFASYWVVIRMKQILGEQIVPPADVDGIPWVSAMALALNSEPIPPPQMRPANPPLNPDYGAIARKIFSSVGEDEDIDLSFPSVFC